jgi:hypothetical protein
MRLKLIDLGSARAVAQTSCLWGRRASRPPLCLCRQDAHSTFAQGRLCFPHRLEARADCEGN